MKRGGQIIYSGPLGQQSQKLIKYFEVSMTSALQNIKNSQIRKFYKFINYVNLLQAIPGIPRIKDGHNPATWMLEISSPIVESQLRVDFAELYIKSELYQLSFS
jgi:hypothetical protein